MHTYMRKYFILSLLVALFAPRAFAQTATDTTVYDVAERLPLPLLARCQPAQHPDWPEDSIRRCADAQLLAVVIKNIRYPEEARQANIEGTVVLSFIVEVAGRITDVRILKDIGGGCGAEAVRVMEALDTAGLRWLPAQRGGKPVRMRQALPLRFRLQEALPYYLNEQGDSIYVDVETLPQFKNGGDDALAAFALNELQYPAEYRDTCKTGIIEMALIIRPGGGIEIENQLDFNNLGMDFQWEAVRLANRTAGQWTPATRQGKPVITTVPMRALFKSDNPRCAKANENFDKAMLLANEGGQLTANSEPEKALEQWNKALELQPDNTELLYYRGSTLLSLSRREEACQDFARVRELLGTTWFEPLRRLACGW
ncbi:MAG: TonB family protein [Lewinellaceae bacterium]|nr:TonB family protein [Lewinellaceae bacterium]